MNHLSAAGRYLHKKYPGNQKKLFTCSLFSCFSPVTSSSGLQTSWEGTCQTGKTSVSQRGKPVEQPQNAPRSSGSQVAGSAATVLIEPFVGEACGPGRSGAGETVGVEQQEKGHCSYLIGRSSGEGRTRRKWFVRSQTKVYTSTFQGTINGSPSPPLARDLQPGHPLYTWNPFDLCFDRKFGHIWGGGWSRGQTSGSRWSLKPEPYRASNQRPGLRRLGLFGLSASETRVGVYGTFTGKPTPIMCL